MAAGRDCIGKNLSQKALDSQSQEMSKRQLYGMLAEAVRNTA